MCDCGVAKNQLPIRFEPDWKGTRNDRRTKTRYGITEEQHATRLRFVALLRGVADWRRIRTALRSALPQLEPFVETLEAVIAPRS